MAIWPKNPLAFPAISPVNRDWQFISTAWLRKGRIKITFGKKKNLIGPWHSTDKQLIVFSNLASLSHSLIGPLTNTNSAFLSDVKPTQLFLKRLPLVWNWHCESHMTPYCLSRNWSALRNRLEQVAFWLQSPPSFAAAILSNLFLVCKLF